MKWPFILFLYFISCGNNIEVKKDDGLIFHSDAVNDDYLIRIRKPERFHKDSSYHLIYVADGTIGTGEYVSGKNPDWQANLPENCIIITIGHLGDWHMKRRRDFIPSDAGGFKDDQFGQASKFYVFLKKELIPQIEKDLPRRIGRSFIGHSFSGLFCLYAAFQGEQLFDRYFSISPSVWANHEELLKIEERFSEKHQDLRADIKIYAGSLEVFNKVLSSSRSFYRQIKTRNYPSLSISFETISGSNHYSVRKPAIDRILRSFK